MAEAKKRFPWWLIVCAAILVPLAAALGLIETVGRQGTIVGRYERIVEGKLPDEVVPVEDFVRVLGEPEPDDWISFGEPERSVCFMAPNEPPHTRHWKEGPADVSAYVGMGYTLQNGRPMMTVIVWKNWLRVENGRFTWWHVRRWAEKAYRAIHEPRR